jgi:hypothetical protein
MKYYSEPMFVKGRGMVVFDFWGMMTDLPLSKKSVPEALPGQATAEELTPEEKAFKVAMSAKKLTPEEKALKAAASAKNKAEKQAKWQKKQQAKKIEVAAAGEQLSYSTGQELGDSDAERGWDLCGIEDDQV